MSFSNLNGHAVADDIDENDSTLGDDQSSLTTSVTHSVFDFRYENGRRYHAYSDRKYPVPNDEIEQDRLDLQHQAFRLSLDEKLYRAPIGNDVHHVLDVGTGTGIWAIEFCDIHPSAQVIGTDLSPIQPELVPPNCSFLIDDCEEEWLFSHHFDFIHTRAMLAAIRDWPRFFQQAYDNLAPGGYLELQEIPFDAMCMDTSLTPETSPLLRWSSLFVQGAAQAGVDPSAPYHFDTLLRQVGFVDVNLAVHRWPVGQWAKGDKWKRLGKFAQEDLMDWLSSGSLLLFTRVLGWSRERLEVFLAEIRRELKEHKERCFYGQIMLWYARKPQSPVEWNSTDAAYFLEESIHLDVDEKLEPGDIQRSTSSQPLVSPSSLVVPTAGLSLATGSRATTPTNESSEDGSKSDFDDSSTLRGSWVKLNSLETCSVPPRSEGNTPTASGPTFMHDVLDADNDTASAPCLPKATPTTETEITPLPPPLDNDFAVAGPSTEGADPFKHVANSMNRVDVTVSCERKSKQSRAGKRPITEDSERI
ncbi:S-adenosyl-L-methionine-dependent methyltransferase [Pleomassaria siparia CBS 279.74]|uniref:S-adenosyl-L-methionine-dependent methyltransferase n=1 Tax=Pleomassaria siparia CBS 279.74 TaxID=1314801 RepID=A0A6G1K8X0_9PLEO|nr:S-adenosyl-L-methionine-dependent methyltransferase [Pleomassaria siparia CBS 279.74]